jgi:twitching motility protein PilI
MTQSNTASLPEKPLGKPDAAARRTRLREFQTQLMARMQAARSGTQTQTNQLGVMIGQKRCLLNLQQAGEILSIGAISKVPLTQDWFLGLANIRGNLISVVDFARFQGMPATPIDKEARIVGFASTLSFNCGLLVSRVLGLRNVEEMQARQETEQDAAPWSAHRFVDRDDNLWTEIDLSLVIQDPRFLQVGL